MHPLVFLIGCLGTRFGLAYLAWKLVPLNPIYLHVMALLAILPAVGFTLIYLNGWRKTGPETSGAPIWWNAFRPLHAVLYFAFIALVFMNRSVAWVALLIDAMMGLGLYILHKTSWPKP